MITIVNKGIDEDYVKIRCLSTDDLPVNVPNGSEALFIDNGKTVYFDEGSGTWLDPTE